MKNNRLLKALLVLLALVAAFSIYTHMARRGEKREAAVSAISSGFQTSCALMSYGEVECWGRREEAESSWNAVYAETPTFDSGHSKPPTTVPGISTAIAVTEGVRHACALEAAGTVKCWGDNTDGALGRVIWMKSSYGGDSWTEYHPQGYSNVPLEIPGIKTAESVSGNCALLLGGHVKCWGFYWAGLLGKGAARNIPAPVAVSGIESAVAISAGEFHACALLYGGTVACWGHPQDGLVGGSRYAPRLRRPKNRTEALATSALMSSESGLKAGKPATFYALTPSRQELANLGGDRVPKLVRGIDQAVAVSAGEEHSCAVLSSGSVKCWGQNGSGQLGDGTTVSSTTAVRVESISKAYSVAVGPASSCALLTSGRIGCWGANSLGQLGDGLTRRRSLPVAVKGISSAIALSLSTTLDWHACALLSGGIVKCWGSNGNGALGNGEQRYRAKPVGVKGLPRWLVLGGD